MGKSKKEAEQEAAKKALEGLGMSNDKAMVRLEQNHLTETSNIQLQALFWNSSIDEPIDHSCFSTFSGLPSALPLLQPEGDRRRSPSPPSVQNFIRDSIKSYLQRGREKQVLSMVEVLQRSVGRPDSYLKAARRFSPRA